MATISNSPLEKKLGMKSGQAIRLIRPPHDYFSLFDDLPEEILFTKSKKRPKDMIHVFVQNKSELEIELPLLKNEILSNGMIWVSWPKKSSSTLVDINENDIRNLALSIGLVDVKVCSVNEKWSALKLVIPLKSR